MDVTRIHEYTDIYMEAYMRALNKTHNADLAVQVAMGVTFAVTNTPEPTKEISVIEHQCSYGSIMNLLEIWADGSIQGYLSAKQTLRIIERIKARESPR